MEKEITKSDWLFLLSCLFLGILAEESFFRGVEIGISYLIFIIAFYSVFYFRYRNFSFSHQRLGWLVLICIWLLAIGYFTHITPLFYVLNILVIPFFVLFHLILITGPRQLNWNQPLFAAYGLSRLIETLKYYGWFASAFQKNTKKGINGEKINVLKKVSVGLIISVPLLGVVLTLLISADLKFKQLIGRFPNWSSVLNSETIARMIIILVISCLFFGILQVLLKKQIKLSENEPAKALFDIDGIIAVTLLIVLNLVYVLFTFIQFKYFFGRSLQGDITFAQYARKGFFELLFVSVINFSILTVVLTFVSKTTSIINRILQIMLTILVLASTVILCSAFLRLNMYEEAYGFTFTRVLAHSFMMFLVIVFAFSFVKIWLDKLSLSHFVFISAMVYYTAINTVDLNQLVVTKNIDRFEESGKIDVQYLNSLSYTGILGLISLYEKDPKIPNLAAAIKQRQLEFNQESESWQSFNLKKQQVIKELNNLKINQ